MSVPHTDLLVGCFVCVFISENIWSVQAVSFFHDFTSINEIFRVSFQIHGSLVDNFSCFKDHFVSSVLILYIYS